MQSYAESDLSAANTRHVELERNNATLDSDLAHANTQIAALDQTNADLENGKHILL